MISLSDSTADPRRPDAEEDAPVTGVRARIEAAADLSRRTLRWFPVRVWRHFLHNNGFLLAAGISYQSLFAAFAALTLAFAVTGMIVGGSEQITRGLIGAINSYIPGVIGPDGLVTVPVVEGIASGSIGTLGLTGAIAAGIMLWTATNWVTYMRKAVRDMFTLPAQISGFAILKALDLGAALLFGAALIVGGGVSALASGVIGLMFDFFHWDTGSAWFHVTARVGAGVVALVIDSVALAALFRFLGGAEVSWRTIWPGALLGGAGIVVLQFAAGLFLSYSPSNPLLATFAVFVAMLLWFRLVGIVILVAASWIAVSAADRDEQLRVPSEQERRRAEQQALLVVARIRARERAEEAEATPRWRRARAQRAADRAAEELRVLEERARARDPLGGRPGRRHGGHHPG